MIHSLLPIHITTSSFDNDFLVTIGVFRIGIEVSYETFNPRINLIF